MVFPWAALAQLPAAKPSGASSHLDAHETSPDQMTPPEEMTRPAQARLAGSQLRDGKTHVALQSPAVVQHPLKKTTITGFPENWFSGKPVSGIAFCWSWCGRWQRSFGVLGCQLHAGGEHQHQPRWIN